MSFVHDLDNNPLHWQSPTLSSNILAVHPERDFYAVVSAVLPAVTSRTWHDMTKMLLSSPVKKLENEGLIHPRSSNRCSRQVCSIYPLHLTSCIRRSAAVLSWHEMVSMPLFLCFPPEIGTPLKRWLQSARCKLSLGRKWWTTWSLFSLGETNWKKRVSQPIPFFPKTTHLLFRFEDILWLCFPFYDDSYRVLLSPWNNSLSKEWQILFPILYYYTVGSCVIFSSLSSVVNTFHLFNFFVK